jgi:ketosteroid isomerase-like protein
MSTEANKQIVTDFLKKFSASDYDSALEMMAEDGTWWVAGSMPISGTKTKAEFVQLLAGVGEMIDGPLTIDPYAMTAEGDRVAVEATSSAEHVNGKSYRNEYHFLFVVKNGRISAVKEYLDTMHANDVLCT